MNDKNTDFQAMKQGYPNCRVDEVSGLPFRSASLFSGIGGSDLAADWMGWESVFHCEWNPFGKQILQYYWPKAISYDDITKTDFSIHRGDIDILTGGFPCQPYSAAGKRLGKEDERHLWPEMLRAIREIAPRYIVGENVYGLVNWNGGMVFDEVQADLEAEGYEVQPVILPACAVNAPHRRERIFFVAYANKRTTGPSRKSGGIACNGSGNNDEQKERGKQTEQHFRYGNVYGFNSNTGLLGQEKRQEQTMGIEQLCTQRNVTNTNAAGQWWNEWKSKSEGNLWEQFPTESPLCGGNDGLPSELDGITFPKWRSESLKAYGNAIVPQVIFQIYKAIAIHNAEYGCR